MALVLVKETGAGLGNANSYADAADGDAYHEGHLYASSWTGASTGTKEAALVMATRVVDALFEFRGYRAKDTQALLWPRQYARDDDRLQNPVPGTLGLYGDYFASDAIPKALHDAVIETARELIKADRTADPDGEGLHQLALTGVLAITFNPKDRRPQIPHLALAMLAKLGTMVHEKMGSARLVRT